MRRMRAVRHSAMPNDVGDCDALGWQQSDRSDAIDGDDGADAFGWSGVSSDERCGSDGDRFDDVL
ncbi:MAG: hypothetical protein Q7T01_04050 [bacterium]|nr:hypothetical protein [bacterium]